MAMKHVQYVALAQHLCRRQIAEEILKKHECMDIAELFDQPRIRRRRHYME